MNTQQPANNRRIILIVAAAIVVLALLFYFLTGKKKNSPVIIEQPKDSIEVKKDTVLNKDSVVAHEEYDEGEEAPYTANNVIAPSVPIASGKLMFGDKVYLDDAKSNEKTAVFYLENPVEKPQTVAYSAEAAYFIQDYQFDEFRKNFSLPPYTTLPLGVKKLLLTDNYSDGNTYVVTQNAERAKTTLCTGDFDGDGIKDIAVITDNNEKQISRLKVFCTNAVTKAPYVAYTENYSDKVRISCFTKGARIFMNSADLVNSPSDGIIVTGENIKLALLYNRNLQKFKTYFQESSEDVGVPEAAE